VAVFRITSYTKRPDLAKKSIRYITHRRDRDGKRVTRALFGKDGGSNKREAYEAIDKAPRNMRFFRMMISPDPKTEDTLKDLDLREITEQTMLALQKKFPRQHITYFAALHPDHTDKRHVHLVALIWGRIPKKHLAMLRKTATAAARAQRLELDGGQAETAARTLRHPQQQQAPVRMAPADASQSRPVPLRPVCPNCGPGAPMEKQGRQRFECSACGIHVYLHNGMQQEAKRSQSLTLSLSTEGVMAA
jgi:ribosomal protein S27AE